MSEPLKIGVLLSGSGTNLQAIIDAVRDDGLPVDIVKVVSSRPDAYGIERAQQAGIPVVVMDRSKYADVETADQLIVDELRGVGQCPSTGVSAARTSRIMDLILRGEA